MDRISTAHTAATNTTPNRTPSTPSPDASPGPSGHGQPDYVGRTVVDERHRVIGTVVDVVYDNDVRGAGSTGERPAWLVVGPGMFRAAHWMPAAGTYRSADDRIVTPWDRELVKRAPKASDDHVVTPRLAGDLHRHYEVSTLEM